MATEAQINANRINAKASTGPKTEDGKGKAARNNTKFGLFATNNCVQPHEKQDYDHFCDVLWSELAPLGGIEEVTAAEYVRNAWRLRRCASAEEFIGGWGNRIQTELDAKRGIERPIADPVIFDQCLPTPGRHATGQVLSQLNMERHNRHPKCLAAAGCPAENRSSGQGCSNHGQAGVGQSESGIALTSTSAPGQSSTPRNPLTVDY